MSSKQKKTQPLQDASTKHELDSASQEFIEDMGLIYQADNLPRIAGRIVGFLMIKNDSSSLQELADALQVSRGSVSTNTRLLDEIGMIELVGKAGERQQYYRLAIDPYSKVLRGAIKRMERASKMISTASSNVPKQNKGAHQNIDKLAQFYQVAMDGIQEVTDSYESKTQEQD